MRRSGSAYSTSGCTERRPAMARASESGMARSRATTCAPSAIGRTALSATLPSLESRRIRSADGRLRRGAAASSRNLMIRRLVGASMAAAHAGRGATTNAAASTIQHAKRRWHQRCITTGSDVQIANAQRVALDELSARLDLLAHQGGENLLGGNAVLDLHLEQPPRLRIHGRFPELVRVHLPEPLIALNRQCFARFAKQPVQRALESRRGCAAISAANRRTWMHESLQYVRGRANLSVVAASQEVGVERCGMARPMPCAHDQQPLLLGLAVVSGLDAHFGVGDSAL